ncbi:hypothetical protein BV22DRAFT_1032333 [Leucogyrophana mollusca]|uniref:Uncharacterized protein n=1 Tax=Leucogyrophana mollusca TaxID=85980 RepID=A0ACB8BPC2_9AGAM|nr:hypothetical protein BV22DRAFT_1032333 [Leucogyrophana mollusca]
MSSLVDSEFLMLNSYYIGNNFNTILYGVELVLYFQTMQVLLKSKATQRKIPAKFFMIFSTTLLFLITIFVVTQMVLGEEMWIINANYPGGQAAYYEARSAVWCQTVGAVAPIILQLMSDGLLVYRCFIVWADYRVIIFPCILWLATLVFGIIDAALSGAPSGDFWEGFAAQMGVTYYALSIGLNIVVTSIICGRILYQGRRIRQQFGPAMSRTYFSAASIIIESALPYTISGIALVITFAISSGICILFQEIYVMFTCVSPQMLILRVAMGRAWVKTTATQAEREAVTSIAFAGPSHGISESRAPQNRPSVTVHLPDLESLDRSSEAAESKEETSQV